MSPSQNEIHVKIWMHLYTSYAKRLVYLHFSCINIFHRLDCHDGS